MSTPAGIDEPADREHPLTSAPPQTGPEDATTGQASTSDDIDAEEWDGSA